MAVEGEPEVQQKLPRDKRQHKIGSLGCYLVAARRIFQKQAFRVAQPNLRNLFLSSNLSVFGRIVKQPQDRS